MAKLSARSVLSLIKARRIISIFLCLVLCLLTLPALAAEDLTQDFEASLAALKTPMQEALETGEYELRLGQTAYVPSVAPDITPFDKKDETVYPDVNGTFFSSDESVITVDARGLMTAVGVGNSAVGYDTGDSIAVFSVTVSEDSIPELAKNMVYVAKREFLLNQKKRMPKYNQYAKWYYGKHNEVGWCSVFTIWCANASGVEPIKKAKLPEEISDDTVLYLREGQVGHQYDGFWKKDRFVGVPRPGYLVIYANMKNSYRTNHIGIVVDVEDKGDGIYKITTVEGNMSNTVKSYCYLYDSNIDNSTVGQVKKLKLRDNMATVDESERTDPKIQYTLHTDSWSVFGFCAAWK